VGVGLLGDGGRLEYARFANQCVRERIVVIEVTRLACVWRSARVSILPVSPGHRCVVIAKDKSVFMKNLFLD
jgi:hypothetical protein